MRDRRFERSPHETRRPPPPDEIERARALGREVARDEAPCAALRGSTTLAQAYSTLQTARPETWVAFRDGLTGGICESEDRRKAWVDALRLEIARGASDPATLLLSAGIDARTLEGAIAAWKEETDPCAVWGRQHDAHISFRGDAPFFQLNLLLALDRHAWCEAVDGLASPAVMEMAFFMASVVEDSDLILQLLRAAPPVYDAEGRWVGSRSVVGLLIAERIVEHAKALHGAVSADPNAVEALAALEREEIPRWFADAFSALVARPDGRAIALGLLGHVARAELLGQPRFGPVAWWAEHHAFHSLAAVLAAEGLGVADVRTGWLRAEAVADAKAGREAGRLRIRHPIPRARDERHGEGASTLRGEGLPLLLGAAVMLGAEPRSPENILALWRWLDELLVGRDPGLSLVQHGSSLADVPQRLGFLVARVSEVDAIVRASYVALEPQRRRAAFWYRYTDYDANLPSALLLRIGFFAAANLAQRGGGAEATRAQALFWWLYEAARRLWLTGAERVPHADAERQIVTVAFAFMSPIFGEALGDALRRALQPIGNVASMVGEGAWFLWKNGIPAERVVRLFGDAGIDLRGSLEEAHAWARLTDVRDPRRGFEHENPAFPMSFEDLARAIGVTLETEEAEGADAGAAERAFRRRIPWAAALLERLRQDGCELARVDRLDAPGSAWLAQISLSAAVHDRFGIAPELRVLVSHGHVRGRDLRLVLHEPRGRAAIDPDLIVVAGDEPDLARRLPLLAGPWGQRVAWVPVEGRFESIADALATQLPAFDLFDTRDPVRGSALVGRRPEVQEIAARLLRGEALGVVGLRKVGKSSLLRAVAEQLDPVGAHRGMFESLTVPLPRGEHVEALVVSLDVQGIAGRGLEALVDELADELEDRLSRIGQIGAASEEAHATNDVVVGGAGRPALAPLDRLRELIHRALRNAGLPVCFILDEYDLLFTGYAGEPGVPGAERLLAMLRAEAQATGRVSLALIGRDPRVLDEPLLGGFTNPLAGWARHFYLGPLRRADVDDLLARLGRRIGLEVGPASLDAAWRWTGGHPLLARQYGAALYDLAHGPPSRPRPVPTDPIHGEAGPVFLARPAVHTVCTEIDALLNAYYPAAHDLLQALADAKSSDGKAVLTQHGGAGSRAAQVLTRFGLLAGAQDDPWIADVYRHAFGARRIR